MIWDIGAFGPLGIVALVAFQLYSGENLDLREQHAWVGIAILSWVCFASVGMVGQGMPVLATLSPALAPSYKA